MADSWQNINGDSVTMDWSAPQIGHLWRHIETARRALLTRYEMALRAQDKDDAHITARVPVILRSEIPLMCALSYRDSDGGGVYKSVIEWLDYYLTESIPYYVNHTVEQDDRVADDFVYWDEASLLTAIGDAAKVAAPVKIADPTAWLIQMYKMVNLLRWTTKGAGTSTGNHVQKYIDYPEPQAVADFDELWALMLADYNAASWTASSVATNAWYSATMALGSWGYGGAIRGGKSKLNTTPLPYVVVTAYNDTKCYVEFFSPVGIGDIGPTNFYSDYGFTENRFYRLHASASDVLLGDVYDMPDWVEYSPHRPLGENDSGWVIANTGDIALLKFDGANGFKFRGDDW